MARAASRGNVLLLHPDETFQRRVRSSLPEGFGCWTMPEWSALRDAVRDAAPTTVALVDPCFGRGPGGLAPELRGLLADFSWFPVVAALEGRTACAADVRTLREWGVAEVLVRGMEDTPQGIAGAVRHAQRSVLRGTMQEVVPPYVAGPARLLLLAAAEAIARGGHAPDLAAALHVTETTVMRRCERLCLPPPRRLLAWARVLLAARLLDQPGRTSQSVAYACGYATEAGLRRVIREFLGTGVTELRRRGALEVAAGAFLAELRRLRAAGREARPVPPEGGHGA